MEWSYDLSSGKMYQVTRNEIYLDNAQSTVKFILNKLLTKKVKLYCTDTETVIQDLKELLKTIHILFQDFGLYETCFDINYLELAVELNSITIDKFYDKDSAGFF